MVNTNCRNDGKSKLDSRTYRANFLSKCNKTVKERRSNMSKDSGNDCEPRHKKQRRVGLAAQVTRDVHNDVSEHIQQVDEIHKKRMLKLTQKQNVEILEYFRTKTERKELLDKIYQLEKYVIREQCGESLSKVGKLKQLDEDFKIKFEGLRHEMDKHWKDLKAEHLTARTNEEEMRLKKIELLQSAINTLEDGEIFEGLFHEMENFEVTTLRAGSDGAKIDASSTKIDLGNPNTSLLESESAINTLEDGKTYTSPTVISSPVPPLLDLSPREILNMANDNVEMSPDNSPKEYLIAIPVDPDKQIDNSTDPVILGEPVISSSSSVEEVTLEKGENQVSQGLLPSSVLITDSQSLKESGQSTSNGFVVIGSDDKQIYVRSVPVPVDETAFPISSTIMQLDVLSIPVTPDNLNASDCSPPLLVSSLGDQGPIYSMQSSEELTVPSDTIHDNSCKEKTIICLDSDDEQIHEVSAATPVNERLDANNLSEEAPGISSEQPNHFSIGCSRNEPAASLSSKENQHKEAQRMLGGVAGGGSSSCEALPSGGQSSMSQDTAIRELRQQTQGNVSFSMPQQQCIDQSRQLPLEQLPSTQLPSSEIRVTDESLPSSSCQYVTDNHLMTHPTTGVAEGNVQTRLSDTTSNYYLNHSRNSYVTIANSYQPSSFDPLQIELAKINKAGYAAKKNYEDMVVQLEIAREKEIAQIWQKYGLLFQEAENDARQKRKELELCYEKTKAHKLLAEAWTLAIDVNSPIFYPSTQVQSTGMQTNALALSPRLVNQFSDIISSNQIVIPHYPPYQNLLNSEAGWESYVPNPHIYPSFPTPSIPSQSNQHPLNFSSSGSSTGYYSHFYS